jgi:hypothetical protein
MLPNFTNWPGMAYTKGNYTILPEILNWSNACVEDGEYFTPFTVTYFLITLLSLIGFIFVFIKGKVEIFYKVLSFVLLGNLLLLCSFVGITQRYMADAMPVFLFLSLFSISHLNSFFGDSIKIGRRATAIVLIALQFFSTTAVTINFWNTWPDRPDKYLNLPFTK